MTGPLSWDLYRTLLAVLDEGSLSGAARSLDLTQPTIGRHVDALERAFGQTLFTRSPAGLMPTEAALALRDAAAAMKSHAAALERGALEGSGSEVSGTVRISASEVIAVEVLPAALARLRREHPGLVIELVPSNRVQDLLHREVDVAVRMMAPTQEALIARRVGDVRLGLFAHRDYLRLHGTPETAEDLAGHSLIGFDVGAPHVRAAVRNQPEWQRERFALRTDSDLAQLALLRAGCGIGPAQLPWARREPALVRVLADRFGIAIPTWITMHEGLRASRRCQVVFEALVRCLEDYTAA